MFRTLPLQMFCIASLFAQGGDLRGVVTDSTNGERIPFASVMVPALGKGAATNVNGFYLLPNLPPGLHQVAVTSIGYQKRTVTVSVGRGAVTVANIVLSQTPVEFSEVLVVEKGRRDLLELSSSVHVIENRDLRIVPVVAQDDLFRAIQVLPGVLSTSDVNTHFYVRGGGGDQNLILLDGMKIYNPYHAFGVFSILDGDLLRTTEVYTGAYPAGFGGRLSSVVNMTTRDGADVPLAGRATLNLISGKLRLEGRGGEAFRWLASGRKSLFPGNMNRFLRKPAPLSFYDGFFKVSRVDNASQAKYGIEGLFSGDDLLAAKAGDVGYRWRSSAVGIVGSGLIDDRVFVDVAAYENHFHGERMGGTSPTSTIVTETGVRTNLSLFTESRDVFYFGFEFGFPSLEYKLINSLGVPVHLKSAFAETWIWLRYQTTVMDLMTIDAGVHGDLGSVFQRSAGLEILQPRITVSTVLTDDIRLKLSYGRYNQNMVTVNNEDDVIAIFDAWIRVPMSLRSETSEHYVAGIDVPIVSSFVASVQSYFKTYDHLLTYNRDKVDANDPDYVGGTGESYGVEVLLRYGVPWLDGYVAYTNGKTILNNGGMSYPARHDRRHTVNVLLSVRPVSDIEASVRWEYGSGFPFTQTVGYYDRLPLTDFMRDRNIFETGTPYTRLGAKNTARLPSYHRLDCSVSYRFEVGPIEALFGVSVVNAYDRDNILYIERTTGRTETMLPFFPTFSLTAVF